MSLAAGQVVLGRYKLSRELPGSADLWRWEAIDTTDGATVELVAPTLIAALRPEAAERFRIADRGLPEEEATLHRLARGLEGRHPIAVRPSTRGPWPLDARLEPDEIAGLIGWLGRVILDSAPFPDGLRREDLSLDSEGVPRLAPLGLVHGGAIHDPPRHRPPELRRGEPATPESALYGLGVLLFRAATGQDAVPGDTTSRWERAEPRRARALRPDLPEEVAELLDTLLSDDPWRRREAVLTAPANPARLQVAPESPAAAPRPAPARATVMANARPDVGIGRWSLAVQPARLNAPTLRRAAALAGSWPSALTRAGSTERWVPILEARSRDEADREARRLAALGVPVRLLPGGPPWGKTVAALGLGLSGALLGLLGTFLFFPLLLLAVLALGGGLALGAVAMSISAAQRSALTGRSALVSAMAGPDEHTEAERSLAKARRQALEADLPEPARHDLLTTLDEAEDQLAAAPPAAQRAIITPALQQAARSAGQTIL